MMRLCCCLSAAMIFLAGCSPDGEKPAPQTGGAPAEEKGTSAEEAIKQPETATAVPYKTLGWDSEKGLLLLDGKPFTGITVDHYVPTAVEAMVNRGARRLKARYHVAEGVYDGLVEEWYDNGNQKTKTTYAKGKHQGDNFYWNSDGTLQVHKVWKDNNLVSETPGAKD